MRHLTAGPDMATWLCVFPEMVQETLEPALTSHQVLGIRLPCGRGSEHPQMAVPLLQVQPQNLLITFLSLSRT